MFHTMPYIKGIVFWARESLYYYTGTNPGGQRPRRAPLFGISIVANTGGKGTRRLDEYHLLYRILCDYLA